MKKSAPKKKKSLFKTLLILFGALLFAYGLLVLAVIGTGHWFNFMPCAFGAFFVLLGLLVPFFKRHKKIGLTFLLLILVVFVNFVIFEVTIIREANVPPETDADWVIVLGAKVNGTTPSLVLRKRAEGASDYLAENAGAIAVTTGGKGFDEGMTEAEAAKNTMISFGTDASRILVENESTSTLENLENTRDIIRKAGGSLNDSVVIVTSDFHIYRAKKLASSLGYTSVSALKTRGLFFLNPYYFAREYAATIWERFHGNF